MYRMYEDQLDPINSIDMPHRADSAAALDFLLSVKSAARFCAVALTETANTQLRETLRRQMEAAIDMRREVADLMVRKGWLYPHEWQEQFKLDQRAAETAVYIARMELFPQETDRMGLFATPDRHTAEGGASAE